jgi:hypothetical protein
LPYIVASIAAFGCSFRNVRNCSDRLVAVAGVRLAYAAVERERRLELAAHVLVARLLRLRVERVERRERVLPRARLHLLLRLREELRDRLRDADAGGGEERQHGDRQELFHGPVLRRR